MVATNKLYSSNPTWAKFCKHLENKFLPYNSLVLCFFNFRPCNRVLARSIDEYSEEFYSLISRVRGAMSDSLYQWFAPQLSGYVVRSTPTCIVGGKVIGAASALHNCTPPQPGAGLSSQRQTPPIPSQSRSESSARCFGCGELGQRLSSCPKASSSHAFFTDDGGIDLYGGPPVFDTDPAEAIPDEHVVGDTGPLLVIHRACLSPPLDDSSAQQNNIFEST